MTDHVRFFISEIREPLLKRRVAEMEPIFADMFTELTGVVLTVVDARSSWHVASYDWRHRRIELNCEFFAHDTYNTLPFVLAHEMVHAVQWITRRIPYGERAADVFALSRLPVGLYPRRKAFYVKVPNGLLLKKSHLVKQTAERSIMMRSQGTRCYISWFESELKLLNRNLLRETRELDFE